MQSSSAISSKGGQAVRISLASSSKMSLHDRFTKLAKIKTDSSPKQTATRKTNQVKQIASAKNRRLALQMANRPSVQTALKLKNRSIKQRINFTKNNAQRSDRRKRVGIDPARLSLNGAPVQRAKLNLAQRLKRANNNNSQSQPKRKLRVNLNKQIGVRQGANSNIQRKFKRFRSILENK